jgi:hypothetical protein
MTSAFLPDLIDLCPPLFSVNNAVWRDHAEELQTPDQRLVSGNYDPSLEIEHHVQSWSTSTGGDYSVWLSNEDSEGADKDEVPAAATFGE